MCHVRLRIAAGGGLRGSVSNRRRAVGGGGRAVARCWGLCSRTVVGRETGSPSPPVRSVFVRRPETPGCALLTAAMPFSDSWNGCPQLLPHLSLITPPPAGPPSFSLRLDVPFSIHAFLLSFPAPPLIKPQCIRLSHTRFSSLVSSPSPPSKRLPHPAQPFRGLYPFSGALAGVTGMRQNGSNARRATSRASTV